MLLLKQTVNDTMLYSLKQARYIQLRQQPEYHCLPSPAIAMIFEFHKRNES